MFIAPLGEYTHKVDVLRLKIHHTGSLEERLINTLPVIVLLRTGGEASAFLAEREAECLYRRVFNRYGKGKRYPLYTYDVYADDIKKKYGKVTSAEDYKNISKLIYSYHTGVIMIYHDIETEERYDALIEYLIDALINPESLPDIIK